MPIKVYNAQIQNTIKREEIVEIMRAFWRVFTNIKSLIIGLIISFIPILNFAVYGFGLVCARKPYDKALPSWRGFGRLWVQGLLVALIAIFYMMPAAIIFGFSTLVEGFDILLGILTLIFGVFAYYFIPMAWLQYAHGSFKNAFQVRRIAGLVSSWKYFGVWLATILVAIIVASVLQFIAMLLAITIVGPFIITGLTAFWLAVFTFTLYGQLYQELKGRI